MTSALSFYARVPSWGSRFAVQHIAAHCKRLLGCPSHMSKHECTRAAALGIQMKVFFIVLSFYYPEIQSEQDGPTYFFELIVRISHTHKCLSISFSTCWPEVFLAICWKLRCTVGEPKSTLSVQHHHSFKNWNDYKGNKLRYSLMFFSSRAVKVRRCSTHLYCGRMMQGQHKAQEVDHYRACIQNPQPTAKQWSSDLVPFVEFKCWNRSGIL